MLTQQFTQPIYQVISSHVFGEIRQDIESGAKAFFALQDFNTGDLIVAFEAAAILKHPTYLTVQTGEAEHIHLKPEHLQYINHSCNPNALFNTDTMQLECLQNIKAGDELCFFYPATEWDMAQPFDCLCGSQNCISKIQGAKYISTEVLKNYKLTSFIQSMLNNKND
jgi:SET domain-containing protein